MKSLKSKLIIPFVQILNIISAKGITNMMPIFTTKPLKNQFALNTELSFSFSLPTWYRTKSGNIEIIKRFVIDMAVFVIVLIVLNTGKYIEENIIEINSKIPLLLSC